MIVYYQATNFIEFIYDFVDQDGVPIDISGAASVTLYLELPAETKTLAGSYSATTDKNRAIATTTATTITNGDLGLNSPTLSVNCPWQFKVVLTVGNEPIWSPAANKIRLWKNLG